MDVVKIRLPPHLYLVISVFCLSLGSVLVKGLLNDEIDLGVTIAEVDPLLFLVAQLVGSLIFLVFVSMISGHRIHYGASWRALLPSGFVVGVGALGTILALNYTTASEASVVFATQPIMILVLAWLLLSERPGTVLILLGGLAFMGVAVIVGSGSEMIAKNRAIGAVFAIISTACAALNLVRMKEITATIPPVRALIVIQSIAAMIALLAWVVTSAGWSLFRGQNIAPFPEFAALGIAALTGVMYYGLAFFIYLLGLKQIAASQAGLYLNLIPVFTIGLAYFLLGEMLSPAQWVGVVIVMCTVLLVFVVRNKGGISLTTRGGH